MDQAFGEVPKWLKGLPWKGSRSLVAARGFKSLLLRSVKAEKLQKKVLDNGTVDMINYQSCCKRESKTTSKKLKNFLTSREQHDIIAKLFETNGNAKNEL